MGAPKGNQFWKARSTHGRKPLFTDSEVLKAACLEYFQWVEDNPLWEHKVFHAAGELTEAQVPKMRAMTIMGLCNFLDMDQSTWEGYRAKKDFFGVCTRIEQGIRQQKFEGASAEFLNPQIIARDLGLAEKREEKITGDLKHTHEVLPETDAWIEDAIGDGSEAEDTASS